MTDLAPLWRRSFQVAYRMLGIRGEAEDIAQEAVMRLRGPLERGEVRDPSAYVTTVATRLAIDYTSSSHHRREVYVGPWLPEPLIERDGESLELVESLSYALQVVLENLTPVERAAFLLHDSFGFTYPEVAETLDRSEIACRQLVSRARRRVHEQRPRRSVDAREHRDLLEHFLRAARHGDLDGLRAVLSRDVVLVTDAGAHARAARRPVYGRDRVAGFVRKIAPKWKGLVSVVTINGEPGFVVEVHDRIHLAGTVEVHDGQVAAVRWVLNPAKLHRSQSLDVAVDGVTPRRVGPVGRGRAVQGPLSRSQDPRPRARAAVAGDEGIQLRWSPQHG